MKTILLIAFGRQSLIAELAGVEDRPWPHKAEPLRHCFNKEENETANKLIRLTSPYHKQTVKRVEFCHRIVVFTKIVNKIEPT
ncbi:hypothetical protein [Enterovibrio coralii]|uniref:Uncharacterized protein n=1 Tax=Enterovibrio coralii TaxID=294935 RepID=A0A135I9G0_9GAMM|nr:hypothetical protein [Enterovibrio coralii]KXF82090.1 hypothetical protein ATN88_20050 [Enterovibrio coralii]